MGIATTDPPALRPEEALLLACARPRPNAGELADIAALAEQDLDWERLLRLAERHGLRPLLYQQLTRARVATLPEAVATALRHHYQRNAVHNLALTRALFDLLDALGERGIAAIPFKGPLLAEEAYGSLPLRESSDLDLLVPEAQALRALGILEGAGYQLTKGARHRLDGYHRRLVRPSSQAVVELHWGMTLEYFSTSLDFGGLWQRAGTTALSRRPVACLAPEDTLLLLCIHGARHQWLGLVWISDLAGLIRARPDLDWQALLARARLAGAERMVLLGLRLASVLLATPPPGHLRSRIEHPRLRRMETTVAARLFKEPHREPDLPETFRFFLGLRERSGDRWRLVRWLLLALVTPVPEDRRALRLPRGLAFLYYLLRPFRAVGGYLRKRTGG